MKEALGFAADDPNVTVRIVHGDPRDSNLINDVLGQCLGFERACEDKALGRDTAAVTNFESALNDIVGEFVNGTEQMEQPANDPMDMMIDRLMPSIDRVMDEVKNELIKAIRGHERMHSAHEGYAVILEEVDELWDEVKADRGYQASGRKEAKQVAAMGARYLLDLDPR